MIRTRLALPALLAGLALGCASAKVQDLETKEAGPLPKPPLVLVYDFAVSPQDVDVDRWGLNDVRSEAPTDDQRKLGEAISRLFTKKLVEDLNGRGIKAQRGVATTPVPLHAAKIEGVFVSLKEGDEAKRTMIGLGYGASKVQAHATVYQQTAKGPRALGKGSVETKASRSPGSVASLARGSYMGLIFKVAMKGAEKAGAPDPTPEKIKQMQSGIEGDVRRSAKAVGDRIEQEYRKQGWL
jgi:hypothetical protein